ncbi:hypothetical protein ACFPES_12690 [Paenibacillus sp. GCM10023248]|uniref:hypothetical protein n=1 Tax=Bacillales TaxID=1385 RepID=UPI0023789E1D|nr:MULTISPECIES: hypothetical protein [Bacillales]MDD9267886.1 hypothetical protein [Paenibacillus sp. MAHUQ-63]MDR6882318.1 hypothetical protein [Bacillus sp. 3255]
MFDPTIYDNIKVVLEGAVYDVDLEGRILITRREDLVDLSSMSRTYAIEFARKIDKPSKAEINLHVHLSDLAAEILENPTAKPGCTLTIKLYTKVTSPEAECRHLEEQLGRIWEHRPQISQQLSYTYGKVPVVYRNQITLSFGRKIDESHLDDFPHLIDYAVESLVWLDERGS